MNRWAPTQGTPPVRPGLTEGVQRLRRTASNVGAVVASALALALYAHVDWPWLALGWVGLVPWLVVLDRVTTLRGAVALAWLMCEAFVLAVFAWLPSAIHNYTGASWFVALAVVLLVAPVLQPQFIACALARRLMQRGAASFWNTALVGACAYVGAEWTFPKLFADTLGHGLYASALLRQAADLAGAHGLTFLLVIVNECVLVELRAVRGKTHGGAPSSPLRPAAGCAAILIALLAYGALRYRQFSDRSGQGDRITAGVVQADISHYGRLAAEMGTYAAVRLILDTHFALSTEALARGPLDLLIWPETVYPTTFGASKSADGAAFDREIGAFAARMGVPLVFGAYDAENGDEFNAAFVLQPADGRVGFDTYRKASLFPLTERVPAWLETDLVRRWWPWLGTWTPGNGGQVVSVTLHDGRTLRVAPLICYDALFPRYAIAATNEGAEVIVTLSNDSWFTFGNVPRLILVIAAFRSIETRRPQVRATNTGISAIITPTGDIRGAIGVHERTSLVAAVQREESAMTVMLAWGDWGGPTALVVGGVSLGALLLRRVAQRGQ